jgi:DNA-binding transcriptional regulator YhcF (GntR family)
VNSCKEIFINKTRDYGTSWRVYRTISVADQIYIKARRIRNIQEKGEQKINDDVLSEFKGILNYAIIGLIQLDINDDEVEDLPVDIVTKLYDDKINIAKKLMQDKNHDYGEAWRDMSQQSFVDMILARVLRIKKILSNNGSTIMSEGIDANYFDIINYAVFALILA